MCDSARCPQATHHPTHRPVWAEHAERTKTFIGQLGKTRTAERSCLQNDYTRAQRVIAEIDAATGSEPDKGRTVRITAAQRTENENRIRAAMDRLLRGEFPPGGNCDIKTLAHEAAVDRTAFYGNRPYAHLRAEFEDRLRRLQNAGTTPDPKIAQVDRLKADNAKLKERIMKAEQTIAELGDFRSQTLARLAAQHEEILRFRAIAGTSARVVRLPAPKQQPSSRSDQAADTDDQSSLPWPK